MHLVIMTFLLCDKSSSQISNLLFIVNGQQIVSALAIGQLAHVSVLGEMSLQLCSQNNFTRPSYQYDAHSYTDIMPIRFFLTEISDRPAFMLTFKAGLVTIVAMGYKTRGYKQKCKCAPIYSNQYCLQNL